MKAGTVCWAQPRIFQWRTRRVLETGKYLHTENKELAKVRKQESDAKEGATRSKGNTNCKKTKHLGKLFLPKLNGYNQISSFPRSGERYFTKWKHEIGSSHSRVLGDYDMERVVYRKKNLQYTDTARTWILINTFLLKAVLKVVWVAGREVMFASAIKSNGRKNLTEKIKQLFDSRWNWIHG